jgi:uncharacterized protein YecT (DUF1311 family)
MIFKGGEEMKNHRKLLSAMLTVILLILAACANSSEKSNTNLNNQSSNSGPAQNAKGDSTNKDQIKTGKTENSSEGAESKKDEYLKRLNEMEGADRYAEVKTTTAEMIGQEVERYKKWDEALNEIYGILKEQLSTEQMDKLREEQRNWIKQRDEMAKESSLKYKGGSMESLEYVATQASLTRERCYELVAKYIK